MKGKITIEREILEELDDLLPRMSDDDPAAPALRDLLYKKIRPLLREPCPACSGHGRGWSEAGEYVECKTCSGSGFVAPYDARQEALELIALTPPERLDLLTPGQVLVYPVSFDPCKIARSILARDRQEGETPLEQAPEEPVLIFEELRK